MCGMPGTICGVALLCCWVVVVSPPVWGPDDPILFVGRLWSPKEVCHGLVSVLPVFRSVARRVSTPSGSHRCGEGTVHSIGVCG